MLSRNTHTHTTSRHQLNSALFGIQGFRHPSWQDSAFRTLGIPAHRHCGQNIVRHSGLSEFWTLPSSTWGIRLSESFFRIHCETGFTFSEKVHSNLRIWNQFRILCCLLTLNYVFTAKRPFDLPSESKTGFTVNPKPVSIIEYSHSVKYNVGWFWQHFICFSTPNHTLYSHCSKTDMSDGNREFWQLFAKKYCRLFPKI